MLLLLLLGPAGCNGDKVATYEPITDPAQLFMSLRLNHGAITMATGDGASPYDTLQLVATPLDVNGAPITGLPAPTFTSSDTTAVTVSKDGLLTAHLVTATPVEVVAEVVAPGNVRRADTARVNVTDGSPQAMLATLSIHPAEPDSAIWSVFPPGFAAYDSLVTLPFLTVALSGSLSAAYLPQYLRRLDAAQNPIFGLAVEYLSLDPAVASLQGKWSGQAEVHRAGRVRMVARATAYGITKADTVTITVTPPVFVYIPARAALGTTSIFGGDRTIQRNGLVMWLNTLDRPVDVVFDDPTNVLPAPAADCEVVKSILGFLASYSGPGSYCNGGNITIAPPDMAVKEEIWKTAQLQQFPQVGTYAYHDAATGASGRIIVVDGTNGK